jgi:hypothetical protein
MYMIVITARYVTGWVPAALLAGRKGENREGIGTRHERCRQWRDDRESLACHGRMKQCVFAFGVYSFSGLP